MILTTIDQNCLVITVVTKMNKEESNGYIFSSKIKDSVILSTYPVSYTHLDVYKRQEVYKQLEIIK